VESAVRKISPAIETGLHR